MAAGKSKRRGYDQGGSVGSGAVQGARSAMQMAALAKMSGLFGGGSGGSPFADAPMDVPGSAKGGKIKRTSGPRIGKDDGLIPAQRGEYVVRRSAVKKLGTKVLDKVNKGKLPAAGRR